MPKKIFIICSLLVIVFSCKKQTARRTDYLIQGIDVSRYQGRIDWAQVAEQDFHFAFVKATEGSTHIDTLFAHNWDELSSSSMARGAYHFYRPSVSAELQARHFINQVEMEVGDLPPVLDIEVKAKQPVDELRADLLKWLNLVEEHYGVKPILYTNQKFYNKYLAGHFNDYPLWIARYNEEEPVLACGRKWGFWQYGNRGLVKGIDGHVDLNVFRAHWEDFERLRYRF